MTAGLTCTAGSIRKGAIVDVIDSYWLGQRDAFTAISKLVSLFPPGIISWMEAQAYLADREAGNVQRM